LRGRRRHRPFRLRPPVGRRGRTNPPPSSRSTRAWSRHDARPRTLVVYRSTRTDPAAAGSFYPLTDITAPTVGLREMLLMTPRCGCVTSRGWDPRASLASEFSFALALGTWNSNRCAPVQTVDRP